MRFLIAQFSHETNTFSPVPTRIDRFCREGSTPLSGATAIAHYRGTGTCMGGFLDVAQSAGAEVVVPIAASAPPSGPVELATYETCVKAITDTVAQGGFDGLMLDLHGAMVAEHVEDGEGELLRRIRAIDPKVPIAVALDMHANIYEDIVKLSTVIAGYHLYPHTDMAETARRAGSLLVKATRGEARPTMAWGNVPMLPHVMAQGTHQAPNKGLQEKASRWEADGTALSAALFVGFSHADIREAGLSAVVTTDGDPIAARRLVDELLHEAWAARHDFVFEVEPLDKSVARAKAMPADKAPIFLLDHYDNCASGGTMDTTAVLAEIMRQDLEDVAFFGIYDPQAVQQAMAAGIGARIKIAIGGKHALPALDRPNPPLDVEATVKTISIGSFTSRSASNRGVKTVLGPTVVLDTGKVEIVLLSKHVEPTAIDMLSVLGIDPRAKRYVAIKSRVHWRADLGKLAGAIVECAGLGVCTSNYDEVTFKNVRRPIFPLEPDTTWPRN
ncbi:MAG: M81 family metallopeptidase [Hyphomicrobiales bacterium]|nr:M81 family metallopeptidase [Hyphomicrobiales bacterium]